MYGISYKVSAQALAAAGASAEELEARVEAVLAPLGYSRVRDGVLLCTEPSSANKLLVVHDTIVALGGDALFAKAAEVIEAFELASCGDITGAVREEGVKLIPTQETLLAFDEGDAILASGEPGGYKTAEEMLTAILAEG